jgi:hypothetical protein
MEIDQEPEPALCQLHVRQQLGFVNRQDSVHALEFDNYRVLNQDIHSITAIESYSFVCHWERNLPLKMETLQPQFAAKAFFVG